MRTISTGLTLVAALVHVWFYLLETVFWTQPIGMAALGMSRVYAEQTSLLAANQGLSNGFLAAGLFYAMLRSNDAFKVFFLSWAVVAGTLGGLTLGSVMFMLQALPALAALASFAPARTSSERHAAAG